MIRINLLMGAKMNINFNFYNKPTFKANYSPYGSWKKPSQSGKYKVNRPLIQGVAASSLNNSNSTSVRDLSDIVLKCDNPQDLVRYTKEIYKKISTYNRQYGSHSPNLAQEKGIIADVIANIESKIDFQRLGIKPDELKIEELIEYGSEFAFWTTSLDGSRRNGFERPSYVRNAAEYVELVEIKDAHEARAEFKKIIKRLPQNVVQADKELQGKYDIEYDKALLEYQRLPYARKLTTPEPVRKSSPIYGKLRSYKSSKSYPGYIDYKQSKRTSENERWLRDTFDNTN